MLSRQFRSCALGQESFLYEMLAVRKMPWRTLNSLDASLRVDPGALTVRRHIMPTRKWGSEKLVNTGLAGDQINSAVTGLRNRSEEHTSELQSR